MPFDETSALSLLKKHFGYDSFRPGQKALIQALMDGRDILGIMPTGAGKSLVYQIPALMLEGVTLVISPLISLMQDQVAALKQAGIPAAYFNSALSWPQYKKALSLARKGAYKIIYVAPERLLTDVFLSFAKEIQISLVAVDEAHCVSQWGQNFRPSYLDIARFMDQLPKRPLYAALTATATAAVQKDMIQFLNLQHPARLITGFDRPNLFFEVQKPKDKMQALFSFLKSRRDQCGIIYCQTRKDCQTVYERLQQDGLPVSIYHAGLEDEARAKAQEDFLYDRSLIMVATNAFGMGIDKSNVRYVVHYSLPQSLENYYQEAGRAGRDGEPSHCLLLYAARDVEIAKFLIQKTDEENKARIQSNLAQMIEQDPQALKEVFLPSVVSTLEKDLVRLNKMRAYATTRNCLRSFILRYFGQKSSGECNACSNCTHTWNKEDITEQAQIILTLLDNLPYSFGMQMLVDLLKGSMQERIRKSNLQNNPSYGKMRTQTRAQVQYYLEGMLDEGYLIRSSDSYQTIRAAPLLREVLEDHGQVIIKSQEVEFPDAEKPVESSSMDSSLFDALRLVRMDISRKKGVPPYIVFTDKTLRNIARMKPSNREEMLSVSGVGEAKMEEYGEIFLQAVREFEQKTTEPLSSEGD